GLAAGVTLVAPASARDGPFAALAPRIAPGRLALLFAHDADPLARLVDATAGLPDDALVARCDGQHPFVDLDATEALAARAAAEGRDCAKLPDDFPPAFASEVYRVGALRRPAPRLHPARDPALRAYPPPAPLRPPALRARAPARMAPRRALALRRAALRGRPRAPPGRRRPVALPLRAGRRAPGAPLPRARGRLRRRRRHALPRRARGRAGRRRRRAPAAPAARGAARAARPGARGRRRRVPAALPRRALRRGHLARDDRAHRRSRRLPRLVRARAASARRARALDSAELARGGAAEPAPRAGVLARDRKSTRLNSSH